MQGVQQLLQGLPDKTEAYLVYRALMAPLHTRCMNPGGLTIKAASSPIAKTVNVILAFFGRATVKLAAGDMAAIPALPVIPTAQAGLVVFTIDRAGTKYALMGTPAAAVGAIVPPPIPQGQVPIGIALIENATGSNFVGGTTALDTGSLTVTYVDVIGQVDFDPYL